MLFVYHFNISKMNISDPSLKLNKSTETRWLEDEISSWHCLFLGTSFTRHNRIFAVKVEERKFVEAQRLKEAHNGAAFTLWEAILGGVFGYLFTWHFFLCLSIYFGFVFACLAQEYDYMMCFSVKVHPISDFLLCLIISIRKLSKHLLFNSCKFCWTHYQFVMLMHGC